MKDLFLKYMEYILNAILINHQNIKFYKIISILLFFILYIMDSFIKKL